MYHSIASYIWEAADSIAGPLPTRVLGRTGLNVTILGLGGESILSKNDKYSEAIDYVHRALELGINYFDTAPIYSPSEKRLGEALSGTDRNKIVIASKTDKRDRDGALKQLDETLENLKTDHIDIWQIHHIDHQDEVNMIFGNGGAIEALQEAKEDGRVRYLGVTGHYDPEPLLDCINRFNFDTLLMVTNPADVHKHSMIKQLLPEANKKDMGVVGMKVCCRGRLFAPQYITGMEEALPYSLSLPISTAIVGHDNIDQLEENVRIAKIFDSLSESEMKELENKTKKYSHLALFFRKGNEKYNPFWSAYGQKKGKKYGS